MKIVCQCYDPRKLCQEMQGTSTLSLVEEKKNYNKNANEIRIHIIHRDFTLETLTRRNQHSFDRFTLLLSYSIRIKYYTPNLGPHLRHNRHHTLFSTQAQPSSQINLNIHDQQPIPTHALTYISAFYDYMIRLLPPT